MINYWSVKLWERQKRRDKGFILHRATRKLVIKKILKKFMTKKWQYFLFSFFKSSSSRTKWKKIFFFSIHLQFFSPAFFSKSLPPFVATNSRFWCWNSERNGTLWCSTFSLPVVTCSSPKYNEYTNWNFKWSSKRHTQTQIELFIKHIFFSIIIFVVLTQLHNLTRFHFALVMSSRNCSTQANEFSTLKKLFKLQKPQLTV